MSFYYLDTSLNGKGNDTSKTIFNNTTVDSSNYEKVEKSNHLTLTHKLNDTINIIRKTTLRGNDIVDPKYEEYIRPINYQRTLKQMSINLHLLYIFELDNHKNRNVTFHPKLIRIYQDFLVLQTQSYNDSNAPFICYDPHVAGLGNKLGGLVGTLSVAMFTKRVFACILCYSLIFYFSV